MRISDWSSDVCSSDLWDEANRKGEEYAAKVLRGGQKNLDIEDFVDPEAAMDPGHFEPNAKLKAMDRDGVFAEVIFPEVAGAKLINPHLMGDDWKEVFVGYNNAMADFAAVDPVRLMTAYQLPLYDIDFAQIGRASCRERVCQYV